MVIFLCDDDMLVVRTFLLGRRLGLSIMHHWGNTAILNINNIFITSAIDAIDTRAAMKAMWNVLM